MVLGTLLHSRLLGGLSDYGLRYGTDKLRAVRHRKPMMVPVPSGATHSGSLLGIVHISQHNPDETPHARASRMALVVDAVAATNRPAWQLG